ncbi:hypothetical protein KR059_011218, partial [Drosophila kikkawai]
VHPALKVGDVEVSSSSKIDAFVNTCYDTHSRRKDELDKVVMRYITTDMRPFSVVEDTGFRDMLKAFDPRYKLPCRKTLKNVIMVEQYVEKKVKVMEILKKIDFCAITTDIWTSVANEAFITVTCSFVTDDYVLQTAVFSTNKLRCETNHTAENIKDTLQAVFDQWDISSKIVAIVTDNATSMIKACDLLQKRNVPCFAHIINLVVQDCLKLDCLVPLLTKCKSTVTYFKSSTIAYKKLKDCQNGKIKYKTPYGLVQEMPTRCNSAYEMIKRVILTNEYIGVVLAVSHNSPSPLSAEDIDVLKEISILLAPCADATLSVSTNTNVSISLIIPVICELFHKVNGFDLKTIEGIAAADYMKIRLRERLFAYETRTIPRIATILDPRFKKQGFLAQSNSEEAAKALQEELNSVMTTTPRPQPAPPTEEPTRFSFLKTKMETTVQSLRADSIILLRQHLEKGNQPEKCDPLAYWEVKLYMLSLLFFKYSIKQNILFQMSTDEPFKKISKKFLCIPASSCESERLFSKAGQMISDRRTRLSPSVVDKLLFLNKNK